MWKATGKFLFNIFEYVLHSFVQVKRWPMLLIKKKDPEFSPENAPFTLNFNIPTEKHIRKA